MINLEQLKNLGIKLTKHKIKILNLFTQHKHLDASKIFELLKAQHENISIATIYRILSTLEAKNILVKHNFTEEQCTYELQDTDHHDHIICIKCNNVVEFHNHTIEKIQNDIALMHNFDIISHSLNIYGLCINCKNNTN